MPVKECSKDGKPGYKCGGGYCYTYTPGDKISQSLAKHMATNQGSSIEAHRKMVG